MQFTVEEMEAYKNQQERKRRVMKSINKNMTYETRAKAARKGWKKRKMSAVQESEL